MLYQINLITLQLSATNFVGESERSHQLGSETARLVQKSVNLATQACRLLVGSPRYIDYKARESGVAIPIDQC